jgi:hypothetical protein
MFSSLTSVDQISLFKTWGDSIMLVFEGFPCTERGRCVVQQHPVQRSVQSIPEAVLQLICSGRRRRRRRRRRKRRGHSRGEGEGEGEREVSSR